MSAVVAVCNIKGGVGKTSAAVNLAYLAAQEGRATLVWDLDAQAASTYLLRPQPQAETSPRSSWPRRQAALDHVQSTPHARLDVLPAGYAYGEGEHGRDQLKHLEARLPKALRSLRERYELILLDCPPSVSLISERLFQNADVLLVPAVPSTLPTRTYDQLVALVRGRGAAKHQPRVLTFLSMVDVGKRLHIKLMRRLRELDGVTVLGAAIPLAGVVELMGEQRRAVEAFAPESPAGLAYRALWSELAGSLRAAALI